MAVLHVRLGCASLQHMWRDAMTCRIAHEQHQGGGGKGGWWGEQGVRTLRAPCMKSLMLTNKRKESVVLLGMGASNKANDILERT